MTEEIKNRLEQIQAGKVPDGYIKTRAGIMPVDWNVNKKAKEVFKSHTNKKHSNDMEILAATQENGIVPRSQIDIDIKCSNEGISGYKKVDAGDFIISLRSFQGGIEYSPYNGIMSPAYTVLRPIQKIADEYYKNYFKTESFISRLNRAVYGIRDGKQIGYEDFGDLIIHNPPLQEQQKIAEILTQCDKVITLKKERIEEEKKRKKWLMDKLICNSKQSKGWTHAILGDYILGLNAGTSVRSYSDDDSRQRENVSNSFFVLKTSAVSNGTFDENEKKPVITEDYIRVSCPLRKNTLVISRMNTPALVGACAYCNIESNTIFLPDRLWQGQSKNGESLLWLNYLLNTDYYQAKICLLASGTSNSMKNIAKEDMLRLNISIPNQEERTRIERVLAHYDKLICLYEQDFYMWQQKKKALMRLLLTGIVRV
jgi:restriction endonuclease S subunit